MMQGAQRLGPMQSLPPEVLFIHMWDLRPKEENGLLSVRAWDAQRDNRHAQMDRRAVRRVDSLLAVDDIISMVDGTDSRTSSGATLVTHGEDLPTAAAKPSRTDQRSRGTVHINHFHATRHDAAGVFLLLEKTPPDCDALLGMRSLVFHFGTGELSCCEDNTRESGTMARVVGTMGRALPNSRRAKVWAPSILPGRTGP